MKDQDKVGVIHEIGDLGLGFDEVDEKDQEKLKEELKKQNQK